MIGRKVKKEGKKMLVVRYSAFFDENIHNRKYYNELTLSLITLERFYAILLMLKLLSILYRNIKNQLKN